MKGPILPLFFVLWTIMGPAQKVRAQHSERLVVAHPAARYDSIIASWQTGLLRETFDDYTQDFVTLDTTRYLQAVSTLTDSVCRARLRTIPTPIHLPYNEIVKKHLVAYTTTHKSLVRRMLSLAPYYFPIIEEELDRHGLPLELKFLPVIESALQPTATSKAGAVGLWQFTLGTGRQYGLEITSMVDERRCPIASTRAACRYMKDLYRIFGDWTLALAAYNYGPGNVSKALKRAGNTASTYWDIYPYLPRATRDYIPAFVALTYVYHYYKDHGIKPFATPLPLATDTVMVRGELRLSQIGDSLGMPVEMLRLLNPQYRQDAVPATLRSYPLVLPQQEVSRFIAVEEKLLAVRTDRPAPDERKGDGYTPQPPAHITYSVKKGDTLGAIAQSHGTTVAKIKEQNGLSSNMLKIGQILRIGK
ncbi:lytic transglycosylase domain-containing protein [uncultured Alistipes sp.]|uniref:lytic transglycosylase domain-containing protein n=1 Tax=uncultured Alistipes sp. TaxID=538949 RepID=UPI002637BB59|nr:lytic transglycosylase domain-containing protein [uncultured Alistipes sp.]